MWKWLELAQKICAIADRAGEMLTDKQASTVVELYVRMPVDGSLVKGGTRINWRGHLKRAKVDLWGAAENDPDNAPELWDDIAYRMGYRVAPDVFTSTNAAAMDERMWFGDTLYRSLKAGNTHTPAQAPEVWQEVEA